MVVKQQYRTRNLSTKTLACGTRLIHNLSRFGIMEIPYFAAQNLPKTEKLLLPHLHKDLMEICYIVKGERNYHVGGKDYRVIGNQLFVTWPNEVHGSGIFPHGRASLLWLQIRIPDKPKVFLGMQGKNAELLASKLRGMPRRHFPGDQILQTLFHKSFALCDNKPNTINRLRLGNLIRELLLTVIDCAERKNEEIFPREIIGILEYIEDNLNRKIPICKLAEIAHLSESRLKEKFKNCIGMPPGEYILRRKIDLARQYLIERNRGLTQIALDLSFFSLQHFSDTFRKFTGNSPREYLKAVDIPDDRAITLENIKKLYQSKNPKLRRWVQDGRIHGYKLAAEGLATDAMEKLFAP